MSLFAAVLPQAHAHGSINPRVRMVYGMSPDTLSEDTNVRLGGITSPKSP